MKPAYLPPQQNNFSPPQNHTSPPRTNNPNVGAMNATNFSGTNQKGPATIGAPVPTNQNLGAPFSQVSYPPPMKTPSIGGQQFMTRQETPNQTNSLGNTSSVTNNAASQPQLGSSQFPAPKPTSHVSFSGPPGVPLQTGVSLSGIPPPQGFSSLSGTWQKSNHPFIPGQNISNQSGVTAISEQKTGQPQSNEFNAGLNIQQMFPHIPGQGPNPSSPGQTSGMPGQNPSVSNQPHLVPGQMPPRQDQIPSMSSQMNPPLHGQMTLNQMPSVPVQIPSRPAQMPPMQSQMLPISGHMHPISGQMPPFPNQAIHQRQMNESNQLVSQMQGMSLNEPRSGPHMPPPLNQIAAQQMRSPQAPGYPPMQQQQPTSAFTQQSGYPQQPLQQKRLDPDQMPSPIQVTQDDQRTRSGTFITNQKGLVPPLVTTDFVVQDHGNASPRFIRSTMYNVPISQDIMKQTAVPFSLVISPMARLGKDEYPPPIVNFGELGPVRCIRCKAYMCPYMQFIDSGRRFQCLFCKATTDVPAEYFQHLDHTGQRMDKYERPELVLGTYEFVATSDYCRNNVLPKPPAVIFILDVSYNNIKSGTVQLLCSQMKEIIKHLPVDQGQEKSNMKVGFITYNSSVHFYNIKGTLAAPQMIVVGDTQEMFMPLLDGFLCTPEESGEVIDALMEQIPIMFAETKETEIVLLPSILAGLEALKASECAGKLMVFHSTLPIAEAPGKLRNRDDRKILGTDKERTVLSPQTQAYNQLGQDCVAAGCSVDFFIFNNSYIDIATISQVSRLTGGEVYKYTYFQADIDGERLISDIKMNISRPIAFDSIMRVRTSTGVRPTDFYGYFYMSNTTDIELAAIDCDKGVAVEIKHDDKLSEEEGVYIQAALLYTSCSGQRRLRIINLSLKTCSQMADLYRSCDLDTIINFISKQATYKLLETSPKSVKDAIVNSAAQILATYRKNCATPSSAGQLILPECMKLLPLYVNCLLKSDALSGGSDMTIDDRAFVMQTVLMMDVATSVNYFYPRLIPIHDIDTSVETVEIPSPIRCTIEKMCDQGVYILENGIHMFLWIGIGASPDFIQNVFGAPSAIQIDTEKPYLPELDNPLSIAVRQIIEDIRVERHRCMRLTLVRQREKLEPVFKHFLVEDRGTDGSASYVDFLCHMHKEIRGLLS